MNIKNKISNYLFYFIIVNLSLLAVNRIDKEIIDIVITLLKQCYDVIITNLARIPINLTASSSSVNYRAVAYLRIGSPSYYRYDYKAI